MNQWVLRSLKTNFDVPNLEFKAFRRSSMSPSSRTVRNVFLDGRSQSSADPKARGQFVMSTWTADPKSSYLEVSITQVLLLDCFLGHYFVNVTKLGGLWSLRAVDEPSQSELECWWSHWDFVCEAYIADVPMTCVHWIAVLQWYGGKENICKTKSLVKINVYKELAIT